MYEAQTYSGYHIPLGYNDNRVVLLARDPHWLYAYWEISDQQKNSFLQEFGYDLWEKSIPVLKVTNVSNNTSFYIRINEFSSNWYINVANSDSLYVAELGRRVSDKFFINLASSNYAATPGDAVSSSTSLYFINYKDLKNGKLDIETGQINNSFEYNLNIQEMLGISSPELYGINLQESIFGVSSAELFGINLEKHLGVSSESFIK